MTPIVNQAIGLANTGSTQLKKAAKADPRSPRRTLAVRVLALDYGAARTGVAVSDASGTLARPSASSGRPRRRPASPRSRGSSPSTRRSVVVVGLPLTLRGEHGKQAAETRRSSAALREVVAVPVETADERFTTALAQRFGGRAPEDARRGSAPAAELARPGGARREQDAARGARSSCGCFSPRAAAAATAPPATTAAAPAPKLLRIIFPEGLNVTRDGRPGRRGSQDRDREAGGHARS